jgi:hypothetical protein
MTTPAPGANSRPDDELFNLLDELDRLEELIEDMDELGVNSRAEAEARIVVLNDLVDQLSPDDLPE